MTKIHVEFLLNPEMIHRKKIVDKVKKVLYNYLDKLK